MGADTSRHRHGGPIRIAAAACVLVAGLSLLALRETAYDPTAWLIWGAQLAHGTLDTAGGPSWKPLPVFVSAAAAPFGDPAQTYAWLFVARAGALASLLLAYVLGRDIQSRRAGAVAAAGLALTTDYLFYCVGGNSEGVLVAAVLGGVLAFRRGRPGLALLLAIVAALLRPEVWPVLAVATATLALRRRDWRLVVGGLGAAAAVVAAWTLPDLVSAGEPLRAAARARTSSSAFASRTPVPFLGVLLAAGAAVWWPLALAAWWRVREAWGRPRSGADTTVLMLAAGTGGVLLTVAAMAQMGFSGSFRYLMLPAAGTSVLGGVGLACWWQAVHRRPRLAAVARPLAAIALAGSAGVLVWGAVRAVDDERVLGRELERVLAWAGPDEVRACGAVATSPLDDQAVARRLRLRQRDVNPVRLRTGTVIARRRSAQARESPLPVALRTRHWELRSSCAAVRRSSLKPG